MPTLGQIVLVTDRDDLRLRRLTCGKALPFRGAPDESDLLRAGRKAQPSGLRRGGRRVQDWPKSRRLSASQAAEPL